MNHRVSFGGLEDLKDIQVASRDNSAASFSDDEPETSFEVPDGHGLMIRLLHDGTIDIDTVEDQYFPYIHHNCYAPASLKNVRLLHGGGSGSAVFGGDHPTLGSIVMKHGGPKDTNEVFSLATITLELLRRQSLSPLAVSHMKRRIPEFVMVYISPHHLRDRGKELWNTLRHITYTPSGRRLAALAEQGHRLACTERWGGTGNGIMNNNNNSPKNQHMKLFRESQRNLTQNERSKSMMIIRSEPFNKRTVRVQTSKWNSEIEWTVNFTSVNICLPTIDDEDEGGAVRFLQHFKDVLIEEEEEHNWKVTLTQKRIGGPGATNGADILTSGKLHGPLLETLIHEFTSIMQDLDRLTLPEERQGYFEIVKKEVERLQETGENNIQVASLSKEADSFVGKAITKNFHPGHGRFRNLRLLGEDFREGDFILSKPEKFPAFFLGQLLEEGADANDVFVDALSPKTALEQMEDRGWLDILVTATQISNPSVTDCMWTCGLTDAGLHNTFLCQDRGLEVFDLGEPGLEPRPAFLTKFLMSFFHTMGMESDGRGSWTIRFRVVDTDKGQRLEPTPETSERIPYLYQIFRVTVNHFIEHIFEGEERVRELLIKYVVLQLLSDASFCLQRWELKGGGTERVGDRAAAPMEQWLWRSLWDQYIACYVLEQFLNQN